MVLTSKDGSTDGAQYMAVLRAKHESNRWEDVEKVILNKSEVA